MKNRERNGRTVVQNPAYEDSGVAISGELGEHSFSGECEGIVSFQAAREPKGIEEDANPDPRFECSRINCERSGSCFYAKTNLNDTSNMFYCGFRRIYPLYRFLNLFPTEAKITSN